MRDDLDFGDAAVGDQAIYVDRGPRWKRRLHIAPVNGDDRRHLRRDVGVI